MAESMQNLADGYDDDDASSQYSDASSHVRNFSAEVCRRVRLLFLQQLYTDVKFVLNCGIKPKPTLYAHKAILAVGSEKFKEILFDNNSDIGLVEIQINNIPYDPFRNVVEYLYTEEVFFEDELSAMETLSAAMKFQMQSLVDKCESYFETSELNENNVGAKFQIAISHKLTSLKNRCSEFIKENTEAVLRSPTFVTLNASTVRSICKMEKLSLHSELELLTSVLRWVEAQPDAQDNRRALLEPILRHIRILTLSCQEFNTFVQNHPLIFTAPEAANILTYLANPGQNSNLPSWCNRGCNRCTISEYLSLPRPRKNIYPSDQYFSIPLKQSKGYQFLNELKCVLKLTCTRDAYVIKAIKLTFDDPVYESSAINHLVINVEADSMKHYPEERLRIASCKSCIIRLRKVILIKRGQTVCITLEAKDITNYKFLQFDDSMTLVMDSPFTYSLASELKQGKLFLLHQVIYRRALKRPEQSQRYRKR